MAGRWPPHLAPSLLASPPLSPPAGRILFEVSILQGSKKRHLQASDLGKERRLGRERPGRWRLGWTFLVLAPPRWAFPPPLLRGRHPRPSAQEHRRHFLQAELCAWHHAV